MTRPLHRRPGLLLGVVAGGALGTLARDGVGHLLPTASGHWPTGTFAVNVAGAFVLGLLLEALTRAGSDDGWRRTLRLVAGTGFCGGLTTYSTLAVETDLLVRDGHPGLAVAYAGSTVVAGLLAVVAGARVGGRA